MAEDEEIMMDDASIAVDDIEKEGVDETKSYNIIPFIMDRYKKADDYREQDEQRWLRAYRNYRGLYGSDVQFTEAEKSRVFIKVTKTKTLANKIKTCSFINSTDCITGNLLGKRDSSNHNPIRQIPTKDSMRKAALTLFKSSTNPTRAITIENNKTLEPSKNKLK